MFKSVSRSRKEKGRLRRDARAELSRGNQRAGFVSPRSLVIRSSVLRHANLKAGVPKRIAPSRREGALTPRCLFSLCSLCPPCELCFSRQVQKRIARSRREEALTPRWPHRRAVGCRDCAIIGTDYTSLWRMRIWKSPWLIGLYRCSRKGILVLRVWRWPSWKTPSPRVWSPRSRPLLVAVWGGRGRLAAQLAAR